ncbi:MAG: type I restriction enzyme HsdR N-terminal domain-containing protein [Bacteroidales bacterium]|nr:type I restriction enzyme HsdR N-terminal domain-containing protein [Bacteroidales bacterium]
MKLNLPEYEYEVRHLADGTLQIHDRLRGKFVALTPEEWVRQHFVNFLIAHRGYPPHLMANEVGIRHNGCLRRCDTIIYDHYATPIAIVEYKAPEIEITSRVFDQIVRYNMVLKVRSLMVSNGMAHYACRIEGDSYHFLRDVPLYDNL